MSDAIKHECGIALIRLLKPLDYYIEKYGTPTYGLDKMYLLMEKQHNRGQDGAGAVCVKNYLPPGNDYISRFRSVKSNPIKDVFDHINQPLQQAVWDNINIEDAECAVKYGADLIGFILAKSPRQIEINKVKDIINKLNSKVLKVAVVVDEHIDEAVNAVREGWLDAVQFQGDVREDIIESLNISWYKVIRVNNRADFNQSNYYSPIILYDTFQ